MFWFLSNVAFQAVSNSNRRSRDLEMIVMMMMIMVMIMTMVKTMLIKIFPKSSKKLSYHLIGLKTNLPLVLTRDGHDGCMSIDAHMQSCQCFYYPFLSKMGQNELKIGKKNV